ncbi:hypothetical protein [Microbacterium sp. cx-59]|uniref:hypothetical protein n=1 Tax=Microbacterium sp. cx-59 TaxID=2891207 RepID=UPI001E4A984D|nr:hypothetical protein [Microbacterium sp. cx-59]MCC4906864.1 hypothetical protein [Microbacterium sp. cx-59]
MADPLTTRLAARWAGWPAALRIGILYLAARAVTTGFFVAAAALSGPTSRFGANATVGDLAMGWDSTWYWFVAVNGYPAQLPLTDTGLVAENQWAFMPLYPFLAGALGTVLGGWGVAAVLISLVAGYGASWALYRMLRLRLDRSAATWAVVFFAAGPLAALFQVGYAESLFLFWLFLALLLVMRRRYAWLYLLVPVMGFTRPGVLAFSLFLALFGIWRWFRRRVEPLPAREVVHIVALGLWAAVVGFSWQVIAAIVTGDASAYLATELAWRRNWIPDSPGQFFPFDGFLEATRFWAEQWGWPVVLGYVVLGLLIVGVAAALLFAAPVRRLGVEIRLWSAAYLLYLLAVFFPQSSIFRLLLPVTPLWGALAVPRSTAWRIVVLVAGLGGQWWWIYNMYGLANTFWRIP